MELYVVGWIAILAIPTLIIEFENVIDMGPTPNWMSRYI